MKNLIKRFIKTYLMPLKFLGVNFIETDETEKFLLAKIIISDIIKKAEINTLSEVEFKVFSQWGEDGIIQYLISKISIPNKVFIEFGVGNYKESNTRFLLMNNNWKGLVIDCFDEYIKYIRHDPIYWKYDLIAVSSFITRENINTLLSSNDFTGDIGLLSIDTDGNDYWIWKEIDVIMPRIVVIEYNSCFGPYISVTIPYQDDFVRTKAHYSNLYFGASLKAIVELGKEKGYVFIGANSAGNNAFFLRKDVANNFKELSVEEGFIESKFRESRDKNGNLTYLRGIERIKAISGMEVYETNSNKIITLKEAGELQ